MVRFSLPFKLTCRGLGKRSSTLTEKSLPALQSEVEEKVEMVPTDDLTRERLQTERYSDGPYPGEKDDERNGQVFVKSTQLEKREGLAGVGGKRTPTAINDVATSQESSSIDVNRKAHPSADLDSTEKRASLILHEPRQEAPARGLNQDLHDSESEGLDSDNCNYTHLSNSTKLRRGSIWKSSSHGDRS